MNLNPDPSRAIPPETWRHPDMRLALARRDIGAVFGLLTKRGYSQRRIGALTCQAQSEVSEILGGRQVMAYDLLLRIADGLGIPRSFLGLGYDPETAGLVATIAVQVDSGADLAARDLIAHAAQVTMGAAQFDVEHWSTPVRSERTPGRTRIGPVDVQQLERITEVLRALDASSGGGSCRDAVLAQVRWAQQALLGGGYRQDLEKRLHVAVADLHNLAGWVSFDIGLYTSASAHYRRALEQAQHAEDSSLVANILYRMGRLHLHLVETVTPGERTTQARNALRLFQLGQIAAQESRCEVTVAMLCANEASAYAVLGDEAQTLRSLARAQDEFARAQPGSAANWVRFFGPTDLAASAGVALTALGSQLPARRQGAVDALTRSIDTRDPSAARSRAFELTALSTVHLLDGDLDHGTTLGHEAVQLAEQIRSTRVADRLGPLRRVANTANTSDCRDLAARITALRAV